MEEVTMQMVQSLIREENKKSDDYEPKVVSLGPYHHGNEKLKLVEDFKPKAVKLFIGDNRNEEDFITAILEVIGDARSCYLEKFTSQYSDEEFARMMLRDACVILNYMGPNQQEESSKKALTIKHLGTVVYTSIRRDMYLLENQVPFKILNILYFVKYGTEGDKLVKRMETFCFKMFFPNKVIENPNDINNLGKEPPHLLEIFRRVVITDLDHESRPPADHCCNFNNVVSCIENCCGCRRKETPTPGRYVFRSVTDLKKKGIHFTASGINSLKGVRFSPTTFCQSAMLKLPCWNVTMYTKVFFKNMIAYELSPNFSMNRNIIAYLSLMKLLVVTKKDVKELRENEIIINYLGSDEQVVQLYNALNTYEGEDTSLFFDVKEEIESHYDSKVKMWMADLKTKYFDNPWSIIAFAGSILLLCLTILQTYYSAPHDDDDK